MPAQKNPAEVRQSAYRYPPLLPTEVRDKREKGILLPRRPASPAPEPRLPKGAHGLPTPASARAKPGIPSVATDGQGGSPLPPSPGQRRVPRHAELAHGNKIRTPVTGEPDIMNVTPWKLLYSTAGIDVAHVGLGKHGFRAQKGRAGVPVQAQKHSGWHCVYVCIMYLLIV